MSNMNYPIEVSFEFFPPADAEMEGTLWKSVERLAPLLPRFVSVTYGADGSFEFQDDVKGKGKGTWSASNGQFCESYAGAPTACGEFKATGDAYFAAKSRLVEMKS